MLHIKLHFQCSGSVAFWYGSGSLTSTLDNGSGSGSRSCSLLYCHSKCQQKSFFSLYLLYTVQYIYISLQTDNKRLRSHKTVEINVLLNFFTCLKRIRTGSRIVRKQMDPDAGGPNADPEHCSCLCLVLFRCRPFHWPWYSCCSAPHRLFSSSSCQESYETLIEGFGFIWYVSGSSIFGWISIRIYVFFDKKVYKIYSWKKN